MKRLYTVLHEARAELRKYRNPAASMVVRKIDEVLNTKDGNGHYASCEYDPLEPDGNDGCTCGRKS